MWCLLCVLHASTLRLSERSTLMQEYASCTYLSVHCVQAERPVGNSHHHLPSGYASLVPAVMLLITYEGSQHRAV